MNDVTKLRDEGNKAFSVCDFTQALSCYSQALTLVQRMGTERSAMAEIESVLLCNRSAVKLNLSDPFSALQDSRQSMTIR